jgi:hypothetical protein
MNKFNPNDGSSRHEQREEIFRRFEQARREREAVRQAFRDASDGPPENAKPSNENNSLAQVQDGPSPMFRSDPTSAKRKPECSAAAEVRQKQPLEYQRAEGLKEIYEGALHVQYESELQQSEGETCVRHDPPAYHRADCHGEVQGFGLGTCLTIGGVAVASRLASWGKGSESDLGGQEKSEEARKEPSSCRSNSERADHIREAAYGSHSEANKLSQGRSK